MRNLYIKENSLKSCFFYVLQSFVREELYQGLVVHSQLWASQYEHSARLYWCVSGFRIVSESGASEN